MQVLEDGRLTDNKGNTISFKNTIIIATSNIGSVLIQQQLQQDQPQSEEEQAKKFKELSKILGDELHKFFKPELLNRFDEIVIFEPLAREDMLSIARLEIENTRKLLFEQGFDLDISQKALEQLAKEGYDPVYGARPLRRLIQSAVENPIAVLIIGRTFISGDKIFIDYDETKEEFVFNKNLASKTPSEENGTTNVVEQTLAQNQEEYNQPASPQESNSHQDPTPSIDSQTTTLPNSAP